MICHQCKTLALEGDLFCAKCGFDLRTLSSTCSNCGASYAVDDIFCNCCGQRLKIAPPQSIPTVSVTEVSQIVEVTAPLEAVKPVEKVPDISVELPVAQTQTQTMLSGKNPVMLMGAITQIFSATEILTPTRIAGLVIAVIMICGMFIFPWFDFFGNSENAVGTLGWTAFPIVIVVFVYIGAVFLSNRMLRCLVYGAVGVINLVVWIIIRFILMEPLSYFIGSATEIMGFGYWLFLVSAILAIILGAVELLIVKKLIPLS